MKEMEKDIGLKRKTQEFDSVVVEIIGKGKVTPIRYNRHLDRWDTLAEEGVIHGQIIAFRTGPFAAAKGSSPSVKKAL
jgi:hypothetical protein